MLPTLPLVSRLKRAAAGFVALAAAAGLGAVAGYRHGMDVERGRHAIELGDAIVATFEATRADAEAESARRLEEARRLAASAAEARAAKREGQLNAARLARPDAALPHDSVRDLNRAIAAANSLDAAPHGMPDPVPAAALPHRPR